MKIPGSSGCRAIRGRFMKKRISHPEIEKFVRSLCRFILFTQPVGEGNPLPVRKPHEHLSNNPTTSYHHQPLSSDKSIPDMCPGPSCGGRSTESPLTFCYFPLFTCFKVRLFITAATMILVGLHLLLPAWSMCVLEPLCLSCHTVDSTNLVLIFHSFSSYCLR